MKETITVTYNQSDILKLVEIDMQNRGYYDIGKLAVSVFVGRYPDSGTDKIDSISTTASKGEPTS